jgi:hypothetical protein
LAFAFEIIKRNLAWSKRSFEIMKKKMPERNLRCGKESYCNKPKPKPIKIDDFDEDLMVNTISKQID